MTSNGDRAETVNDNPESVAAWKRRAALLEAQVEAQRRDIATLREQLQEENDPQTGWRVGEFDLFRPLGYTYDGSSDYSIGYAEDPQAMRIAHLWDCKWERGSVGATTTFTASM